MRFLLINNFRFRVKDLKFCNFVKALLEFPSSFNDFERHIEIPFYDNETDRQLRLFIARKKLTWGNKTYNYDLIKKCAIAGDFLGFEFVKKNTIKASYCMANKEQLIDLINHTGVICDLDIYKTIVSQITHPGLSQFNYVLCLLEGIGIPKNTEAAMAYIRMSDHELIQSLDINACNISEIYLLETAKQCLARHDYQRYYDLNIINAVKNASRQSFMALHILMSNVGGEYENQWMAEFCLRIATEIGNSVIDFNIVEKYLSNLI